MYKKCIAVFICLMIAGNLAHGTVLCFGPDGHTEIESAFHKRCDHPVHSYAPDQNQFSSEAEVLKAFLKLQRPVTAGASSILDFRFSILDSGFSILDEYRASGIEHRGGLITSLALTLIILPVLYVLFNGGLSN